MTHESESEYLHKGPCEECGSSDACATYSDNHRYCFACEHHWPGDGEATSAPRKPVSGDLLTFGRNEGLYTDLRARGITVDTCKKHGYWVGRMRGKLVQVADYRDSSGTLVAQKIRDKDKNFTALGKLTKDMLWGMHLWSGGGKKIIITEGEIDCLTVSQLQGLKWPVVSLPNGAAAAKKTCAANYEFLNGYEQIILMFDMDEPGRKAVQEAAEVLPPGKVFVAQLPLKDANECLLAGQSQAVTDAIWNATPYMPDGVFSAKSLIARALEKADVQSIEFPIGAALNEKTRGCRGGEVITLTSGSGMGKSSFARELAYGWGHSLGYKVGMAFIEEAVEETMLDIAGLHLNKRIRQYPEQTNQQEKGKALVEVFGNDTYYLYDHFGSAEEDSLLNKLRYMITVEECNFIILDHLSIVVSGMDGEGDERKTLDRLMTKLKTLAKGTGAVIVVVVHLKRKEGKGGKTHEEGGRVTLGELRGSGAIAQLSDTVIAFERDQQSETPNVVTVRILKCRFTGDTGVAGCLEFNKVTGRLLDIAWIPDDGSGDSDFDPYAEADAADAKGDIPF